MNKFKGWMLEDGMPSDFNFILLNKDYVVSARRLSHGYGPNPKVGVEVTMLNDTTKIKLRATFKEFARWLENDDEDWDEEE